MRIDFRQLALDLGGELEDIQIPNGPKIQMPIWTDELRERMFQWFERFETNPEPIEFDGHPEVWVTMALFQKLKNCEPKAYIAALGGAAPMVSFDVTEEPAPAEQAVRFTCRDMGENRVYLDITFQTPAPPNPLQQSMSDIKAPVIAHGKDIFVDCNVGALVYHFNLPATYGDECRTMYVKEGDQYVCCVTNTSEVKLGDTVPFFS